MLHLASWIHPFGPNDTGFLDKVRELMDIPDVLSVDQQEKDEFEEAYRRYLPTQLDAFSYSVSGSQAVERALMIAYRITGRKRFLIFTGSYHGNTISLLPVFYQTEFTWEPPFEFDSVAPPHCFRCNSRDCCQLQCLESILDAIDAHKDEYAGILVDPSFGNIVCKPPQAYFPRLKEVCEQNNLLLVFDEIRTGFGRTGRRFAFEQLGVVPDVLCLSKAIACGMPLSLTVFNSAAISYKQVVGSSLSVETTYAGSTLSLRLARYTLERLDRMLSASPPECMDYMLDKLSALGMHDNIGDVRNNGMIYGIEFVRKDTGDYNTPAALVFTGLLNRQDILINRPRYRSIVVLHPYLNISRSEVDDAADKFASCLESIASKRRSG